MVSGLLYSMNALPALLFSGGNDGDGSVRWGDVQTVNNEERFLEVIDMWFEDPYGWRKELVAQQYADYDDLNFYQNETVSSIHYQY